MLCTIDTHTHAQRLVALVLYVRFSFTYILSLLILSSVCSLFRCFRSVAYSTSLLLLLLLLLFACSLILLPLHQWNGSFFH